jgi:hypothetical protein
LTVEPRAVDPHCFDADPDPDPAQNLDADPDPDPDPGGGGGRSAKNLHPPWKNPRYAPVSNVWVTTNVWSTDTVQIPYSNIRNETYTVPYGEQYRTPYGLTRFHYFFVISW